MSVCIRMNKSVAEEVGFELGEQEENSPGKG